MELNFETFENRGKIGIFAILDLRFPSEAIIAHGNFCGIFAIWRLFSTQNARNRFFFVSPENTKFHLDHISKWAKSDRNSLIWLKMKSERSSRKQHFFSHFEQFVLKMRWKVRICLYFVVRKLGTCSNHILSFLFTFLIHLFKFKTTFRTFQRIFS